jgi:hypothetical protein
MTLLSGLFVVDSNFLHKGFRALENIAYLILYIKLHLHTNIGVLTNLHQKTI